ncbi:hypothetical protein [Streptomyces sp. 4N124]
MRPRSAEPSGRCWSDDAAVCQTVEPSDDFTATALLNLSLTSDSVVTEVR